LNPSPRRTERTVQITERICGHEVKVLRDRERRKPYYEPHKEALDKAQEEFGREARLLRKVGAKYLVHLPEQRADMHTSGHRGRP
jgi:hypothetical protein